MLGFRLRRQQISGKLLADETIVGLVVDERLNHVVAILSGLRNGIIAAAAAGVGVAHNIQPHAAPPLTISFRREQALDQLLVSFRRFVVEEGLHFGRRGRKARKIVGHAAD